MIDHFPQSQLDLENGQSEKSRFCHDLSAEEDRRGVNTFQDYLLYLGSLLITTTPIGPASIYCKSLCLILRCQ